MIILFYFCPVNVEMPSHLLLISTFTKHYSLSYAHILFSGREKLISTLNVMAFLYSSTKNDEFLFFCSYLFILGGHEFLFIAHTYSFWGDIYHTATLETAVTLLESISFFYPVGFWDWFISSNFFQLLKQKQQQITLATIWTEPSHQLFLRLY